MIHIKSMYDLHKVPVGYKITYKDRYSGNKIEGILVEILPNTGQYSLKRKTYSWKHYINWDKFAYYFEEVSAEEKEDPHIIPSTTETIKTVSTSKKKNKKNPEISFESTIEGDLIVKVN